MTLAEALDRLSDRRALLLVNERSGRAAVQVPAPSLMLDDGEIERRVRLIRPMEGHNVPLKTMAESHWIETDREAFAATWRAEIAGVPEFTDSTIHIVAGLLLPIWKRLPNEFDARLSAPDRRRRAIVGRKVSPAWVGGSGGDRHLHFDPGPGVRGAHGRWRPSSTSPKACSSAAAALWAPTASNCRVSPTRCVIG